ncbi:hypothetical protein LguiA_020958 [Lonicera macranthoides]
MPATAGRVRMPANNRVHSSAALQTHGIWQSAIGYDPYAPNKEDNKKSSQPKASTVEPEGENAYASFQGLLALARITGSNADEARGACKKCGRVGHLTFQCRNFLSIKDEKEKDQDAIQAAVLSGLEKLKGKGAKVIGKTGVESSEESSEEESESSDSEYDSEIERAIACKHGKRPSSNAKLVKKKNDDSDEEESDKRGRSKKRRSKKKALSDTDSEDEGDRKRRKDKRRRRDNDSSDEDEERKRRRRKCRKEKRRRRSHRRSSDSDSSEDSERQHKRKSRRAPSDSDMSGPEDSRVGRDKKRSEKRSRKRHHE